MLTRDLYRKQFANMADVKVHDIYGASWNKGELPDLTRTDSAVGRVAEIGIDDQVVQNDFDNTPLFGSIREVEDNYENKFIRIPKLYIKKTDTENLKTWQVSLTKRPGFYLPWCFWDFVNNRALPYFDFGRYLGNLSDDGTKLESKSGKYPLMNKNIVQFRGLAHANGAGYQLLDIHANDVLCTLAFIEFATLDIQAIMKGYTEGQYTNTHLATATEENANRIIVANDHAALYRVGQAISIGTSQGGNQVCFDRTITAIEDYGVDNKAISFDGDAVTITTGNMLYNSGWKSGACDDVVASSGILTANDGKYPCMYRGIENPFGNMWQFVDGVNITDNQAWVCKDSRQYASNVFASPYEQLGYVNHNANGYVQTMGWDATYPFAEFPTAVNASLKYYKDYYYQATGARIARFGGSWNSGSTAGLSYWSLNYSSSHSYLYIGGRLLRKPL
jgi:hypothetical protein